MVKEIIKKLNFEEKTKLLTFYELLDTVKNEKVRLPSITMSDGPHGVRSLHGTPKHIKGGSTAFPTASALSATWNTNLAYNTGAGIARDCIAQGVDVILGPGVNIKRSPLCGRNFEYFSEDPVLSGEMGAAYIRGVQEQGVSACIKHYALNNQESSRTQINVEVDERTLREIYLKPFEIAVKKSGPASIMAAYNRVLGTYCTENKKLIDILRKDWGYDGAVISDWGAVKDMVACINAGLNLQMPANKNITEQLKQGIADGRITEEKIDESLEILLKFILNAANSSKCQDKFDISRQHEDAYKVAAEAITLLKNENDILPITKEKYKKIFVLGGWAEKAQIMGGGSSMVQVDDDIVESPIQCIKDEAGSDIEIIYDRCYNEINKKNPGSVIISSRKWIKECTDDDLILFFVSSLFAETEGLDRYSMHFENYIDEIIRVYSKKCKNVAVIMQTGTAYVPFKWDKTVGAIVQSWLLGESGGKAISDVLFGKVNPSGKLSETFPKKLREDFENIGEEETIIYKEGFEIGYRYYDRHPEDIWYPFGHGLSYTRFEYKNLKTTVDKNKICVEFEIENVGKTDGMEAAQVYICKNGSAVKRPVKELKAFSKISLKKGETKPVKIEISFEELAYYNAAKSIWETEDGKYMLFVGASSQDIRLSDEFEI